MRPNNYASIFGGSFRIVLNQRGLNQVEPLETITLSTTLMGNMPFDHPNPSTSMPLETAGFRVQGAPICSQNAGAASEVAECFKSQTVPKQIALSSILPGIQILPMLLPAFLVSRCIMQSGPETPSSKTMVGGALQFTHPSAGELPR